MPELLGVALCFLGDIGTLPMLCTDRNSAPVRYAVVTKSSVQVPAARDSTCAT